MMQPSIGRVVHYVSRGSADGRFASVCRAAIVAEVPALLPEQPNTGPEGYVPAVNLAVLNPSGLFFDSAVRFDGDPAGLEEPGDREHAPGTWHWPERHRPERA